MALKDLLTSESICDYQTTRNRTKGSTLEKILFGLINSSGILQKLIMQSTLSIEYIAIEDNTFVRKKASEYPKIEEYTEFAIAPHLSSIKDVLSCAIAFSQLPGSPAPYVVSKRDNFAEYGLLLGLVLRELGAFPVPRLFPLGDDLIDKEFYKEIKTYIALIEDPKKAFAIAVEGTRQTSGMPGEPEEGLEKAIKKNILKKGNTHHVIPMALSMDIISRRIYVSFCDQIDIGPEEIGRNNRELFFSAIKRTMKVSYNHIASSSLLEYVIKYGQYFIFYELRR